LGDRLRVDEVLKAQIELCERRDQRKAAAKQKFGLEQYNDSPTSMIMDLGKVTLGDCMHPNDGQSTVQIGVDWGIEQLEDMGGFMEEISAVSVLKDGKTVTDACRMFARFSARNQKFAAALSFGYEPFDYARGKAVPPCYVHKPWGESHKPQKNVRDFFLFFCHPLCAVYCHCHRR
jgi:hypothetical protein